jgi:hypothetical protein
MSGLTKTAISAMPIFGSVADFWETEQFGKGKLPKFNFRQCRHSVCAKKAPTYFQNGKK